MMDERFKFAHRKRGSIVHYFPRSGPTTACGEYEFYGGTYWSGRATEITCPTCKTALLQAPVLRPKR